MTETLGLCFLPKEALDCNPLTHVSYVVEIAGTHYAHDANNCLY
jgi:hypothetical protein